MTAASTMKSEEITVTAVAYATDPDFVGDKAGRFTLMHLGTLGNPLLYASFDGQTDSMVLRAGTPSAVQATGGISYRRVWLRVASGSVSSCVQHELASADIR